MSSPEPVYTERLSLDYISLDDWKFILELVNTDGWLQFIGNRNIDSENDAKAYIQKILSNRDVTYWVVRLRNDTTPIGIITWIRRSYLSFYDIGFAFLPAFFNKGYAYESSRAILSQMIQQFTPSHVDAVTIPGNDSSIRLLKKLGLQFKEELQTEQETIHVYETSVDRLVIEGA